MMKKKYFGAVLPAGGIGARMGAEKPKQLLEINGKTLLKHSVEAFALHLEIKEIVVACPKEWKDWFEKELESYDVKIVVGGKERWQSVAQAVCGLSDEITHFLAHDVARPFVSQEIISQCIHELKNENSCMVAKAVVDTVQRVKNKQVQETLDRNELVMAQTPQCTSVELIKACYEKMQTEEGYNPTDEAGMLRHFGEVVKTVEGDDWNDKITRPFDLKKFEAMLTLGD